MKWEQRISDIDGDTMCAGRSLITGDRVVRTGMSVRAALANNREVVQLMRRGLTLLMDNAEQMAANNYHGGNPELQKDITEMLDQLENTDDLGEEWQNATNAGSVHLNWNGQLLDLLVWFMAEVLNANVRRYIRGQVTPNPLGRMMLQKPPIHPIGQQVVIDVVHTASGDHYDLLLQGLCVFFFCFFVVIEILTHMSVLSLCRWPCR